MRILLSCALLVSGVLLSSKIAEATTSTLELTILKAQIKAATLKILKEPKGLKIKIQDPLFEDEKWEFKGLNFYTKSCELGGLKVKDFKLDVTDTTLDAVALKNDKQLKCNHRKSAHITGKISQEALTEYFGQKIKGFKLQMVNSKIQASGFYPLFGFPQLLSLVGKFVLVNKGEQINLVVDQLKINYLPCSLFLVKFLEGKINPILNLQSLPFSPIAKSVKIKGKYVIIT